jgi:predicted Rossmann-fold nucleotide-binding protein
MTVLRTVCVYCGSSQRVAPKYLEAAEALGRRIGQAGVALV